MTEQSPMQPPPKRRRPTKFASADGVTIVPLDGGGSLRIDSQGRILCKAKRRDGNLCQSPVVAGLRVCRMHGASAPDARRKSRQALADLVDPSIRALGEIVEGSGYDPDSAPKPGDVIRAAQIILDRTGFGPTQAVEVREVKASLRERLLGVARDTDELTPDNGDDADTDEEGFHRR